MGLNSAPCEAGVRAWDTWLVRDDSQPASSSGERGFGAHSLKLCSNGLLKAIKLPRGMSQLSTAL